MHIQGVVTVTPRQPDAKALAAEWLVMTTVADWHTLALETTRQIVEAVPADRWQAATSCPEWDVRGLVNHTVSGNLRAAKLGSGATIEEAGDRLDGDRLGTDPARAYAAPATAASAAFHRPGALDAPCAVSYGPVAGSVHAGHRFIDVLIHGWDLATATGQDATLIRADCIRAEVPGRQHADGSPYRYRCWHDFAARIVLNKKAADGGAAIRGPDDKELDVTQLTGQVS
jgi:uncharacterized protein (TIGR03086 family)